MTEIIEISFENNNQELTGKFLVRLAESSDILSINSPCDDSLSNTDFLSYQRVSDILKTLDGCNVYINLKPLAYGSFNLPQAGVQILKYENSIDINVHFDYNYLKTTVPLSSVMNWSEQMSKELHSSTYYCGYEPAEDEDTRFFTETFEGPLKFRNI